MALWRVLDYTSATLRVAVKHPPNNSLKLGKSSTLKPERNGAFAAKPLGESPRNFSHLHFSQIANFKIVAFRLNVVTVV